MYTSSRMENVDFRSYKNKFRFANLHSVRASSTGSTDTYIYYIYIYMCIRIQKQQTRTIAGANKRRVPTTSWEIQTEQNDVLKIHAAPRGVRRRTIQFRNTHPRLRAGRLPK